MKRRVTINRLSTGVPGLDAILGGGLPEFSFNLVVGPPGSGKTTLAHQLMFALATPERPALFFSVLGEPPLKMLRYQQQFSFFDLEKIETSVRFVNLSEDVEAGNYDQLIAHIRREFESSSPKLIFIDSFQSVMQEARHKPDGMLGLQQFTERLGTLLSGWQATSFLIGGYLSGRDSNPVFTVADGLLALDQSVVRNSMVRKLQVMKMRGQSTLPGLHPFRIDENGIELFPATVATGRSELDQAGDSVPRRRLCTGVPCLDEMLGGGLPSGYSLLVAGPSGSGKTILATAFLAEGVRRGEPGVIVAFEQTPSQSWIRTIDDLVSAGQVGLINSRAPDLSMAEIIQRLTKLIREMKATRVVIDSLSGFELALAPAFRDDFRESLFHMTAVLSELNVTVLMTSELEDRYVDLRFSPYGSAFLTDAIIVQRYIEVESCLKRVISVVKVRASSHSTEIRQFEIDDSGIVIGEPLLDFEGLLGGRPTRKASAPAHPRTNISASSLLI